MSPPSGPQGSDLEVRLWPPDAELLPDRHLCSPAGPGLSFNLARSGHHLRFVCAFPPGSHGFPGAKLGDFIEGLWNYDVAELFLARPDGQYVEINFSPEGAWWTASFSAPRQRHPGSRRGPQPDVHIACRTSPPTRGSLAVIDAAIDLRSISPVLPPLHQLTANITSIVQNTHRSWATLSPPQPDFHRPREFARIRLTPPDPDL
jgi:hypothetical protein